MKKAKNSYHHGHLAESLLDAVDEIATDFGIEAVTLRGCAKRVGVSPAAAFRHYADKRTLMTAFATRALHQLADALETSRQDARDSTGNDFHAVGMAYIDFALQKPAFFRAMWHEEAIYSRDDDYQAAVGRLAAYLQGGFVSTLADEDPHSLSPQELLAWSSVHGMASLFIDGPVAKDRQTDEKLLLANDVLLQLETAFTASG